MTPVSTSKIHTLQNERLRVAVDAARGGRITEFSLHGHNVLATDTPETGSTFWPSPQQAWHWPPPAQLDKAEYTCVAERNRLTLESRVCDKTQLRLVKTLVLEGIELRVNYTLLNCDRVARQWAPWEVTRVRGGISFYRAREPALALSSAQAPYLKGHVWHDYRPEQQNGAHQKIFGNASSGWLANAHDGYLLLKRFPAFTETQSAAPGEAEIEIYVHGDCAAAYIELEQQGPFEWIAPGASITWEVTWLLGELPADCDLSVGSDELIDAAWQLLPPTSVNTPQQMVKTL